MSVLDELEELDGGLPEWSLRLNQVAGWWSPHFAAAGSDKEALEFAIKMRNALPALLRVARAAERWVDSSVDPDAGVEVADGLVDAVEALKELDK